MHLDRWIFYLLPEKWNRTFNIFFTIDEAHIATFLVPLGNMKSLLHLQTKKVVVVWNRLILQNCSIIYIGIKMDHGKWSFMKEWSFWRDRVHNSIVSVISLVQS